MPWNRAAITATRQKKKLNFHLAIFSKDLFSIIMKTFILKTTQIRTLMSVYLMYIKNIE